MSPEARLMAGISLILVPTIVYGGLTILGAISNGALGMPTPKNLTSSQIDYYRAGHAHAGVLTLLALFLQIALDYVSAPSHLIWSLRIGAFLAPVFVSGGFFGVAHARPLRVLLYVGALLVVATTLTAGIGLIRAS